MSSRGRDLYPSLHTRHTSPPLRSSSSSSEMSSMPSMLLGDVADASKSRAPDPSGEPVGVAKLPGVSKLGDVVPSEPVGEADEFGFPNDGDAGDRRVRPISRSIFSRRSIAFCALFAFVVRRSSATAAAAAAETRDANAGLDGDAGVVVPGKTSFSSPPATPSPASPPPEIRAKKSPLLHLVSDPGVSPAPWVPIPATLPTPGVPSAAASDSTRSFDAGVGAAGRVRGPGLGLGANPAAFLHSGSARSFVVSVALALRWHPTLSCPAMGTLSRPVNESNLWWSWPPPPISPSVCQSKPRENSTAGTTARHTDNPDFSSSETSASPNSFASEGCSSSGSWPGVPTPPLALSVARAARRFTSPGEIASSTLLAPTSKPTGPASISAIVGAGLASMT
mmetsp:Transcript_9798/g.40144  ORF Transcript_9798/g.40144 Transcript_9798/m.40144 type:complete len:394 (+) Transcript_9798:1739-2920(+)